MQPFRSADGPLGAVPQSVGGGGSSNLGDPQPVISFHQHNLAARDQAAVEQQFNWFVNFAVEFDDRSGGEFENLAQLHAAAAKAQGDFQFNIAYAIERALAARIDRNVS